jgi:hypothetical protein
MDDLPGWRRHLLDQAELWVSPEGDRFRIGALTPTAAGEILDRLRKHSISIMLEYTGAMVQEAEIAREEGEDIPLTWEPDSAPYFDYLVFDAAPDRGAVATQWLETKPLVRALDRQSHAK